MIRSMVAAISRETWLAIDGRLLRRPMRRCRSAARLASIGSRSVLRGVEPGEQILDALVAKSRFPVVRGEQALQLLHEHFRIVTRVGLAQGRHRSAAALVGRQAMHQAADAKVHRRAIALRHRADLHACALESMAPGC